MENYLISATILQTVLLVLEKAVHPETQYQEIKKLEMMLRQLPKQQEEGSSDG